MESAPVAIEMKVVVVGPTGVGKTSLTLRYINDRWIAPTSATIGASFLMQTINIEGTRMTLQIWDTAGLEKFRSMGSLYYRNAKCAILVYDSNSLESLVRLKGWVSELKKHVDPEVVMVVAGNKVDTAIADAPNTTEEALEYCSTIDAEFFATSAKSGHGVTEMFAYIAQRLLARHKRDLEKRRVTERSRRDEAARSRSMGGPVGGPVQSATLSSSVSLEPEPRSCGC